MGQKTYNRNTAEKDVCEIAVKLENISKFFGTRKILDNINFAVKKSDIFALLGPNGAGKTTTMRIISGVLTPSYGNVLIFGKSHSEIRKSSIKISVMLEKDVLWESMSGEENIRIATSVFSTDKKTGFEYAMRFAELLGMKESLKTPVFAYSKGMKRKLSMILALMKNPDFLLLDEPNSGIDTQSRIDIRNVIKFLKKRR